VEPTSRVGRLVARLRSEQGFGLIEIMIAMTVLAIGLFALLGTFTTGYRTLTRASSRGTATVLADRTMEAYRGKQFSAIAAGTTATTYSKVSNPPSPDGRTYTVTATVSTGTATNTSGTSARTVKLVTVTVADSSGHQWVSERSTFDSLTGQ
jgi:prepilin-type N-terminal cleavage/methylation domain-containing protein